MRFSIFATGFAAIAASTPIAAPAEAKAPLDKRTFSLSSVPFSVLTHIPYLPWDKFNIDYSKVKEGSASVADLAKLPVDVSDFAKLPVSFLGTTGNIDFSGSFEKLVNSFGDFNVPINPLSLPEEVKSVIGTYTGDANIDASKIPIDASKLPAYSAAKKVAGYTISKRTFADIPGLSTILGYFGVANLPSLIDAYVSKGVSSFFKFDISKESTTELYGAAQQIGTILSGLTSANSALYKEINGGANATIPTTKYGARADAGPSFTITAKQVSDFINFIIAIGVKVAPAIISAIGAVGAAA